jgi:hypothetical protein
LLPKEKAFDMTTANRLFGFLSLLPLINIEKRPRLILRRKGNPELQTIPFALFEELQEATFLMEYADGIRPYILEWYYDIFLKAYESKKEPDSKVNGMDQIATEKRTALTTEQLAEKTKEVYKQTYTTKQILENFVKPLINQGYIDKTESDLDRRAKIYYPVIVTKYRKLFESEQSNNFSQERKISITDPTLYPDKEYLISKIQHVLRYSADKDLLITIQSHEGKEITVEELVDRYYKDPEKYFELDSKRNNNSTSADSSSGHSPLITTDENRSDIEAELQEEEEGQRSSLSSSLSESPVQSSKEEQENNFVKEKVSDDYLGNVENASELQERSADNAKSVEIQYDLSKKLFDSEKTNNLIYSDQSLTEIENKHQRGPSISSSIVSSTEETNPLLKSQVKEQGQPHKKFNCFYCSQAYSSDKDRVKHIDYEHPGKLYYDTPEDFEKRLL